MNTKISLLSYYFVSLYYAPDSTLHLVADNPAGWLLLAY
jgi:hypothetical protein